MTYTLYLGDYAYSSWSLRGWLMLDRFGLPYETRLVDFSKDASVAEQIPEIAPARTVPSLLAPDGALVSDTMAMAEELATRHPDAGFWPAAPKARAAARSIVAEMHASFSALRSECPMNLRVAYSDFPPSQAVRDDVARIEALWSHARTLAAPAPWLFGDYSLADAFYAPVAARIAGYDLSVGQAAADYVALHLADPAFLRWRALALSTGETLPWYAMDYATRPWPGPS